LTKNDQKTHRNRKRARQTLYSRPDGTPASTPEENIELAATHFEATMTHPDYGPVESLDHLPAQPPAPATPPTKAVVIKAIRRIKSGKATDANGLRIEIFKLAIESPHGANMMHDMVRQWYICGYPVLPDILHRNVLAIIAKKSPPGNNLGDHRGVTIPTVQSKVFSMFNGFNIDAWLDCWQIPEQTGFTKGRSRTDTMQSGRRLLSIRKAL